ncbi:phenylacetate--CoA ligase family protein, partial [Streptococcus danieliae]|nr:phenylacetate--CoA ligase family protein [Streptococcus danieliae]
MTDTLDSLEARAPETRERELMAGLPQLIARAQQAPGWARILDGVNAADIT